LLDGRGAEHAESNRLKSWPWFSAFGAHRPLYRTTQRSSASGVESRTERLYAASSKQSRMDFRSGSGLRIRGMDAAKAAYAKAIVVPTCLCRELLARSTACRRTVTSFKAR
jgi:hypothetical protein